ncbi:MAG: YihY/virulence factor BrkB family protein, partial [Alphaproteobacteria bacterium]|nr:YihY/virulence factor BrkB family protein [Alphaproteobacteria bacterium]
ALVLPGEARGIADELGLYLEHREVVGGVGLLVMLFFSSLAFAVLENAMSVIFAHRVRVRRRHFLTSALIPYLYIGLVGAGLLIITIISGALQATGGEVWVFHRVVRIDGAAAVGLYALGVFGLMMLLTSFYMVLPVGRISWRHAALGGATATLLWEVVRHLLVWYYATLSMVNVIYGSLATAIVALLSLEIAGMILLFGAQVIAEFERLIAGGRVDDPVEPRGL